ncbi:Lsa family ABC-F type ribosomal protection protein [Clostridia bacterium]|nr:Lsa family ABC-F type ribosomal protection protein [Clostridia bacterium]
MSLINVSNLTFCYDGSYDNIFENVSFSIDTDWKLGFIGRNGRGKTTFLKLLLSKYEHSGKITKSVNFDYFPFEVKNKAKTSLEIAEKIHPEFELWQLNREISLLKLSEEILNRPFESLSNGEQTKLLLAILFLKDNNFLLIDEPTNHLDFESRQTVSEYLNRKNGFILISHDRSFLDSCVDHILSINLTNIEVQRGNFSSWWQNKEFQANFELSENEKLKKDISRLHESAKQSAEWSDKVEATKYGGKRASGLKPDRGFVGHKAAKMMKRSKSAESRKNKAIEEKSKLLKNVEVAEDLKLNPLIHHQNNLVEISDLSIFYGEKVVCKNINFVVNTGSRIALKGRNGCGKSSILKLIWGGNIETSGTINVANNLKISYVSQDTSELSGNLTEFAKIHNIGESLFKAILRKLDFSRVQFEKDISEFSEGQKKKFLIAKSLCESAHLYIWDEPLNFIDVLSRMQIEELILKYKPTLLFVEHDKMFIEKIADHIVEI